MKLKLKEDPREWRKFALVAAAVVGGISVLLWSRGKFSGAPLQAMAVLLTLWVAAGAIRPRWIRPVYRGAMTMSFHVGQVMGRVLLTAVFFLVVFPLGMLLRLLGKDLLHLKRQPEAASYWRKAAQTGEFDRQF